jgi:Tat protein secretion system quality control protein TatD with DNase activity
LEAQITITDTHTHLYAEEFDQDRNEMMQRAMDAGVSRFFIPAIDSTCTQAMYDLENNYPENVFLMMGLHPTYVKDNFFGGITTCGGRTSQTKILCNWRNWYRFVLGQNPFASAANRL